MSTYHFSKKIYDIGGVIPKGEWKKFIDSPDASPIAKKFEYYLEAIRLDVAPLKVSRLDCVFTFDKTEHVEGLNQLDSYKGKTIYVTDKNAITKKSYHNYEIITHFEKLFRYNDFGILLEDEHLMYDYWKLGEKDTYKSKMGNILKYVDELLLGEGATVLKKL